MATRKTRTAASKRPAPRKPSKAVTARHIAELNEAVTEAAGKLHGERLLREGSIVLRTDGEAAGGVVVRAGRRGFEVVAHAGNEDGDQPLLEVIGDARRLTAIVRGEKDARKQFLAGGIRVRGDMGYLSELGAKLGFLDTPI